VSSSETFQPPSRGFDSSTSESGNVSPVQRPRHSESQQVLTLPTPLSVTRPLAQSNPTALSGSTTYTRSSEEGGYASVPGSNPNSRGYGYDDGYDAPSRGGAYDPSSPRSPPSRSRVTSPTQQYASPVSPTQYASPTSYASPAQFNAPSQYPQQHASQGYGAEQAQQRPRRSQPPQGYTSEPEEVRGRGGVSLQDTGPVQQNDAVRRVPRSRRPTSQQPQSHQSQQSQSQRTMSPTGFSSASAQAYGLPPGAAPPQPGRDHRGLPPGAAAPGAHHQRGASGSRDVGARNASRGGGEVRR
jgi:chitin synthase